MSASLEALRLAPLPEYDPGRPVPATIELRARCWRGVVFHCGRTDGFAGSPYCPTCGSEKPGIAYVREGQEGGR